MAKRRRERGSRVSRGGEENKGADKGKRERILGKSRNIRTMGKGAQGQSRSLVSMRTRERGEKGRE
jgi:hypothetical protein